MQHISSSSESEICSSFDFSLSEFNLAEYLSSSQILAFSYDKCYSPLAFFSAATCFMNQGRKMPEFSLIVASFPSTDFLSAIYFDTV